MPARLRPVACSKALLRRSRSRVPPWTRPFLLLRRLHRLLLLPLPPLALMLRCLPQVLLRLLPLPLPMRPYLQRLPPPLLSQRSLLANNSTI